LTLLIFVKTIQNHSISLCKSWWKTVVPLQQIMNPFLVRKDFGKFTIVYRSRL